RSRPSSGAATLRSRRPTAMRPSRPISPPCRAGNATSGAAFDALIVRNVPNLRKAVRWNSPMYGIEGQGWFLGFHTFTHYVKVAFFRGTSLRPVPPGASKGKDTRYIDIHEGDELDEAQMANWVKQAAALPGWVP